MSLALLRCAQGLFLGCFKLQVCHCTPILCVHEPRGLRSSTIPLHLILPTLLPLLSPPHVPPPRRTIQYMGFTMMTVCLLILAVAYNPLRENAIWAFIFIYALMFFFANFGPNTTTFIIPGECFPTRYRSTCHGLSAASGKAGAIVGLYAFGNIATNCGYPTALGTLAVFMFAGLLCTYFVPETQGKSLEELGGELEGEEVVKAVEQPAAAAAEEP